MDYADWLKVTVSSAATTAILGATLAFLLKTWVSTQIKESIAAEYEKSVEAFKNRLEWDDKKKLQAAQVAELISVFLKQPYFADADVNHIRYELQRKYWEMSLWLDPSVLRAVHKTFNSYADVGLTHKEALIEVRRLFLGADDPIRPDELHHWTAIARAQQSRPQNGSATETSVPPVERPAPR